MYTRVNRTIPLKPQVSGLVHSDTPLQSLLKPVISGIVLCEEILSFSKGMPSAKTGKSWKGGNLELCIVIIEQNKTNVWKTTEILIPSVWGEKTALRTITRPSHYQSDLWTLHVTQLISFTPSCSGFLSTETTHFYSLWLQINSDCSVCARQEWAEIMLGDTPCNIYICHTHWCLWEVFRNTLAYVLVCSIYCMYIQ